MPATQSPIQLASEGFRFAKRLQNGFYVGLYARRGATHKVVAKYAKPRIEKNAPANVIRCVYADPKNFIEFTGPDRQAQADKWLAGRRAIATNAAPYSAVTIPLAQIRAKIRAKWALEDQNKPNTTMATAKKSAKKAPKAPTAPKAPKDIKNGITRPRAGTTSAKIFDLADKMQERAGVLSAAEKLGINEATATTQFGKWRKYNGLEGRTAKPKAKKAPKAPTAQKKKKVKAPKAAPAAPEVAASTDGASE